jgi:hypothetical protein
MAWAYVQTTEGMDLDAYDAVGAEVGTDDLPAGAILHAAGMYDGKLRVIEVWESEAAYRRFRDERLVPAIEKVAGADAVSSDWPPPGLEAMDVHNTIKPG